MKGYPFLINKDSSWQKLQPIEKKGQAFDERWLQDLIRKQPDILPVAEIEPIFSPLIPIGFEVSTETGAIDNLFISHRGYLTIVETKLWRNPEAKREVVAQAIDYASSVSKWSYDRLNEVVRSYTRKYACTELGLSDWVENQLGPVEGGIYFFEETVSKNLRLGRFLTLIVGDRIRHTVIEMLNYVNKYPLLATDVALVELRCYFWNEQKDGWPLLVVPSVVAQTDIVERSVVQVTINQEGAYQIDARQEKDKDKEHKKVTLTEEAFWELLKKNAQADYDNIHSLIDKYQARDSITVNPTETAVVVKLNIKDTGQQVSLFYVNKNAQLGVWPKTIGDQLSKAGLDGDLAKPYDTKMRAIMKMDKKRIEFLCPFSDANIDEFRSTVDSFIQSIQYAEPLNE